jgi:hypothetical protein
VGAAGRQIESAADVREGESFAVTDEELEYIEDSRKALVRGAS